MKIIDKLNRFVKNVTSTSNKKEDTPSSSLNICDMSVLEKKLTKIAENDKLVLESTSDNEQIEDDYFDNQLSLTNIESEGGSPAEEPTSLLNNSEYMTLALQCCDMLSELDRMQNQVKNEEVVDFIKLQKSRIREALIISGATMIDEETEFDLLRHQCTNGYIVKNGTPIVQTVEPGVEIGERVMVKAKVNL